MTVPVPANAMPTGVVSEGASARAACGAKGADQPRRPALRGRHLGGVGRCTHANRCRSRNGNLRAAVLPVGTTCAWRGSWRLVEPHGGGKIVSSRCQIQALEKEVARLKQECARQQALVRAAQRTIGLAPPSSPKPATKAGGKAAGKRARKRRPAVRALKAAAALRATSAPEDGGDLSGVLPPEMLQRSTVSNPLPPTTPTCVGTVGG